MTDAVVLAKVQKLLRLSASSNANEAALAAAKAQELIDKYNLSQALLALESAEPVKGLDDEPIVDFAKAGAPLDAPKRLDRWRGYLAGIVARANACKIYYSGNEIALIGRPSDAETVRYLYGFLAREVERLTTEQGQGMGRTWRNNFRLGVVDTISRKVREQHAQFEKDARTAAKAENSTALVRVNQALARIEARRDAVEEWTTANLKLYAHSGGSSRYNPSARQSGRKAGESIAVGGARGRITSVAKKLSA